MGNLDKDVDKGANIDCVGKIVRQMSSSRPYPESAAGNCIHSDHCEVSAADIVLVKILSMSSVVAMIFVILFLEDAFVENLRFDPTRFATLIKKSAKDLQATKNRPRKAARCLFVCVCVFGKYRAQKLKLKNQQQRRHTQRLGQRGSLLMEDSRIHSTKNGKSAQP